LPNFWINFYCIASNGILSDSFIKPVIGMIRKFKGPKVSQCWSAVGFRSTPPELRQVFVVIQFLDADRRND
jgi:hypothetical protein